jgi:hypothetical protein
VLHQLKTDRDNAYQMHGKRKVLVDTTFKNKASAAYLKDKLQRSMSAEGYQQLLTFIENEKQNMVYAYVPKGGTQ